MTIMLGAEILNFYNKSVKDVIKEFNTNIKGNEYMKISNKKKNEILDEIREK